MLKMFKVNECAVNVSVLKLDSFHACHTILNRMTSVTITVSHIRTNQERLRF
jgi:hypothetical protein